MKVVLKVNNIAPNVTFNDLKNLFYKYGKTKLYLEKSKDNNKTYGYATFYESSIAQQAITDLNNKDVKGSIIQVKLKKNQIIAPPFVKVPSQEK